MPRYRSLVIGTATALKSPRTQELFAFLKKQGELPVQASDPKSLKSNTWDLIFFLNLDPKGQAALLPWQSEIRSKKISGRFLVLYHDALTEDWRKLLDPEIEIGEEHALEESLMYLFEEAELPREQNSAPPSNLGTPMTFDLDKVKSDSLVLTEVAFDSDQELPVSSKDFEDSFSSDEGEDEGDARFAMNPAAKTRADLSLGDLSMGALSESHSSSEDGQLDFSSSSSVAQEQHSSADLSFSPSEDFEISMDQQSGTVFQSSFLEGDSSSSNEALSNEALSNEALSADLSSVDLGAAELSADLGADLAADLGADLGADLSADLGADLAADLGADLIQSSSESSSKKEFDDVFEAKADDEALNLGSVDSMIEHPDSSIKEPLAGRDTFSDDISMDEIFSKELKGAVGIVSPVLSSPDESVLFDASGADPRTLDSTGTHNSEHASFESFEKYKLSTEASSSDLQTLQKYAAIKEREAREKEATIQVLKGQLAKMETKLTRSESERRRLTLENDELKTQMSTIEEELSQKKFYLQKVEAQHQEELRGINMRLDNAIFQANKAQNRLEDFRERVRNDFVKIRAQERELFNKLELQKRDAEALLASKDEQLLNQRREIDRLQYELETLQEKMMEETERAEERASRLSRALQSLKLATDMLSGLTEEVLPSAGERFPDSKQESEDEAA